MVAVTCLKVVVVVRKVEVAALVVEEVMVKEELATVSWVGMVDGSMAGEQVVVGEEEAL